MSSPYSGSTAGSTAGAPHTTPIPTGGGYESGQGNYAVGPEYPQGATSVGPEYPQAGATGAHSGNLGTPTTAAGYPDVDGVSVGQLIGEVTQDLSTLMRQELELAKAELKVEAKKAGQGAGMFGVAGFAGYMTLLFLSLAAMWGLAVAIGAGWGGLVVAVIWGAVAIVGYSMGRKKFQQVHPKPERTVDTLQKVPDALKPH